MQTPKRALKIGFLLPILLTLACGLPGLSAPPQPAPVASNPPAATTPVQPSLTPSAATLQPALTRQPSAAPRAEPTARPGATQTQTPAPGSTPMILLALGSLQPPPAGILAQIGLLQTGGGGGPPGGDCENRSGEIRWCSSLNGKALPQTTFFQETACGFNNQPVSALVLLPDGRSLPAQVEDASPQCRVVRFTPAPDAPLGQYQITLNQGNAHLSDIFVLSPALHPSGALYQNCAWLAGWPVGQPLRLLIFGLFISPVSGNSPVDPGMATWRFDSERQIMPTSSGSVLACPEPASQKQYAEMAYLAYPAGGRAVGLGDADVLEQFQGICAGGPPTRLARGKNARIIAKEAPLFPDPSFNQKPLEMLPQGRTIALLNGPVCPPQGPWVWQARAATGKTGWLAESDTSTYFLEPAP